MAGLNTTRNAAFDAVHRQQQRQDLLGLSAFDRHKKLLAEYMAYYGGKLPPPQQTLKTDYDALRDKYRSLMTCNCLSYV